ncbi:MAG TPA: glycoside hydrolase family 76 protein [Solirubrobacteraceae bacterium]|nr:glycoside hydrolase family 76 protein [Solirubrobacteraceae bacterium]
MERPVHAERAARAFAAMQAGFRSRDGLYRRDGRLHLPGTAAHLWPFSRALVATLDLAGIEDGLPGFNAEAEIKNGLAALEHYWVANADPPAYSSDVRGTRIGGDRYYDDNAWVGLALVQLERMRPRPGSLERPGELLEFARSGWDQRDGGVFWVEQGRGIGARNHDRNTVSNAPNAELGFHLSELKGEAVTEPGRAMYDWVLKTLDASRGTDSPGTGLFWDKVRGDGSIDETLWTYNQGSMIGANVLMARLEQPPQDVVYLDRAEAIARKSLTHFSEDEYIRQPAAFNAIFFRNLLLLHHATRDATLRTDIIDTIRNYTDHAWDRTRDRHDRFHLSNGGVTLLNQSAIVQLLALLAWDPSAYVKLT